MHGITLLLPSFFLFRSFQFSSSSWGFPCLQACDWGRCTSLNSSHQSPTAPSDFHSAPSVDWGRYSEPHTPFICSSLSFHCHYNTSPHYPTLALLVGNLGPFLRSARFGVSTSPLRFLDGSSPILFALWNLFSSHFVLCYASILGITVLAPTAGSSQIYSFCCSLSTIRRGGGHFRQPRTGVSSSS